MSLSQTKVRFCKFQPAAKLRQLKSWVLLGSSQLHSLIEPLLRCCQNGNSSFKDSEISGYKGVTVSVPPLRCWKCQDTLPESYQYLPKISLRNHCPISLRIRSAAAFLWTCKSCNKVVPNLSTPFLGTRKSCNA